MMRCFQAAPAEIRRALKDYTGEKDVTVHSNAHLAACQQVWSIIGQWTLISFSCHTGGMQDAYFLKHIYVRAERPQHLHSRNRTRPLESFV